MTAELPFTRQTNGLILILIGIVGVIAFVTVVRPRRPSPFSEGGAYGTGHGSDSIMVGAAPRLGAAR
jgi:hypothetical protein